MVVKDACDPDVSVARWDDYDAEEDGYSAAPRAFTRPAARCRTRFDTFEARSVGYALLDIDADGRLDLVVTKDACDDDVGAKRWDVYRSDGSGFTVEPEGFGLPAARCDRRSDAPGKQGAVTRELRRSPTRSSICPATAPDDARLATSVDDPPASGTIDRAAGPGRLRPWSILSGFAEPDDAIAARRASCARWAGASSCRP